MLLDDMHRAQADLHSEGYQRAFAGERSVVSPPEVNDVAGERLAILPDPERERYAFDRDL